MKRLCLIIFVIIVGASWSHADDPMPVASLNPLKIADLSQKTFCGVAEYTSDDTYYFEVACDGSQVTAIKVPSNVSLLTGLTAIGAMLTSKGFKLQGSEALYDNHGTILFTHVISK